MNTDLIKYSKVNMMRIAKHDFNNGIDSLVRERLLDKERALQKFTEKLDKSKFDFYFKGYVLAYELSLYGALVTPFGNIFKGGTNTGIRVTHHDTHIGIHHENYNHIYTALDQKDLRHVFHGLLAWQFIDY